MQFFKHYHNASSSLKLQKLLHELGAEGYGQYWLLLELLCEKFDGESSEIELHFEEISAKVRIKFGKKLETFVQKLANFSLLSFQISGKVYKIDAPILFDLQAKDFKFATKKRLSSDSKNKEERIKNKEERDKKEDKENKKENLAEVASDSTNKVLEPFADDFLNPYLERVKTKTQEAWLVTYPDNEFVKRELFKATTWILNNSSRAPRKNLGQFYSNWLSRSWESYRKTIKTNSPDASKDHFQKLLDQNPWGAA